MARRPPPSSNVLPQQGRQNEYFVPRDGIDREVITADICRYLGNDALVRPGNYENQQTGQIIQGYYINAYRNLTTAMIEDLKADSARWDQERRQQSASRNNASGVQYRNSDTHQSRQYYGPSQNDYPPGDASRDPYDQPRYPGTGSGAYTGASGSFPQQYGSQGGYSQGTYTTQTSQFPSPSANVTFASHAVPGSGFVGQAGSDPSNPPYTMVDAHLKARTDPYSDPYAGRDSRDPRGDPRDMRDSRMPVTTMPANRATYVTAGSAPTQGYPAGSSSSYYAQNPSAGAPFPTTVQPADPFYGRASPAGTAPYSSGPDPQYEKSPAPSRNSATATNAQISTSGQSSRHRERDSIDRHSDSRHGHRSHRSGR